MSYKISRFSPNADLSLAMLYYSAQSNTEIFFLLIHLIIHGFYEMMKNPEKTSIVA